ncbi:MAG: hypothetical protein JJ992_11865, partial [Planctomycetes bacterium]|nr:hypothetical protein [Planctomycetota bacterium]
MMSAKVAVAVGASRPQKLAGVTSPGVRFRTGITAFEHEQSFVKPLLLAQQHSEVIAEGFVVRIAFKRLL